MFDTKLIVFLGAMINAVTAYAAGEVSVYCPLPETFKLTFNEKFQGSYRYNVTGQDNLGHTYINYKHGSCCQWGNPYNRLVLSRGDISQFPVNQVRFVDVTIVWATPVCHYRIANQKIILFPSGTLFMPHPDHEKSWGNRRPYGCGGDISKCVMTLRRL